MTTSNTVGGRKRPGQRTGSLRRALATAFILAACIPSYGAECPLLAEAHIPQAPEPPLNIDHIKKLLRQYQAHDYAEDVAAVFAKARSYLEQRASQVSKPALVLDIDETSLSNWSNISANDFGFIPNGPCDQLPEGACGFKAWILKSSATPIMPALDLFNAAKANGVAVFFITGRRDRERQATLWNLDRAGFEGWAKLVTRPDDDRRDSIQPFKSEERGKIESSGYTIIANVGDQRSDLDGGSAGCPFKVPNPFYFIP
jgi:acid phosphatase